MFDLAIIGLGSAGLEAAQIALKNGSKVIAFEKEQVGGTCLNKGCIPTKAILHCANLYNKILNSSQEGIKTPEDIEFDWQKIILRKDNIVSKFTNALSLGLNKKIELVKKSVKIQKKDEDFILKTDDNSYFAKNIIIATGSIPYELSNLKFDAKFILNSDDMFNLKKLPKNALIVGSGAIGLEWAQILKNLNVDVTIVEKAKNLAPNMDIDIQKRLERILKQRNINFYKDDFIEKIEGNKVVLNSKKEFTTELILSAVGRKAVLPETNFELKINDNYTTNFKNIFVIGDASSQTMLAHNASYQARKVMDKILFNKEISKTEVPAVIYMTPEIASIGIKEDEIENKQDYKIIKYLIPSLAKSWCDEAQDGFIKIILKEGKTKGCHIVSKNASELISIFSIIMKQNLSKEEILDLIFPHPSYSETVLEIYKNA